MPRLNRQKFGKAIGSVVPLGVPTSGTMRLNRRHPIAKDLFFFGVCHNGDMINYANEGQFYSTRADYIEDNVQSGRGLLTGETESSRYIFRTNSWTDALPACTYAARSVYFPTQFGTTNAIVSTHNTNIPNVRFWIESSNERYVCSFSSINSQIFAQSQSLTLSPPNELHDCIAMSSHQGPEYILVKKSERTVSITGASTDSGPPTADSLVIGNRSNNNNPFTGIIEYVALWKRALAQDEALEFQRDPYAVLEPA